MSPSRRSLWRALAAGTPLGWPHRFWLATIFCIGVIYCYVFPPFQTNDEDAHWSHMWGVVYGHLRCDATSPAAVAEFLSIVKQRWVREDPGNWRAQNLHHAQQFVGDIAPVPSSGTACRYPPHPYLLPGLVARTVAFAHGGLRRGSMLRAAYAARLTNWILVTLGILLLCRRLPWMRNFALVFYSLPEVIQQSMAINTDAFLFVATAFLLLLMFGQHSSTWSLVLMGVVIALMTAIKPIYLPFAACGLVVWARLFERHRWRARDVTALVLLFAGPWLVQSWWVDWVNAVPGALSAPDRGRAWAGQQMAFLRAHPGMMLTLFEHQVRDLFGTDLMKGSWLSIIGAFGWSMFTMSRWAYWLMLGAFAGALTLDVVDGQPSALGPPARRMLVAMGLASAAILVAVLAIVVGMYIYFSGAFLGRIGVDDVVGVQGRYYLVPILVWVTFALHGLRRREPLPRRWVDVMPALTTVVVFACVLVNVVALREILFRFYGAYLSVRIPAPPHY